MEKCVECSMPLEKDDDRCVCQESICYNCCKCGQGCGCSCTEKK
ncbi:MAG: hypothetical protein WCT40_04945 [Candidatus Magasanikbacteria bacterium]